MVVFRIRKTGLTHLSFHLSKVVLICHAVSKRPSHSLNNHYYLGATGYDGTGTQTGDTAGRYAGTYLLFSKDAYSISSHLIVIYKVILQRALVLEPTTNIPLLSIMVKVIITNIT